MNRLAGAEEGVLVSDQFMKDNSLIIGDTLPAILSIRNLMTANTEFIIVGSYENFPTVYDDTVTFVGNLDYISTITGLTAPHDLWMRLKPRNQNRRRD